MPHNLSTFLAAAQRAASPAGRFLQAALKIERATGDDRLANCARRGLDTNAERAGKLLAEVEGPAADEARAALADFLGAQIAKAA